MLIQSTGSPELPITHPLNIAEDTEAPLKSHRVLGNCLRNH